MTLAPDHWAYSSPGEVDELPAVHWVSTHMDATHP